MLAGRRLLAFQAVAGGAEELTAGVEVGAVRTLVPTVVWHVQFGTADLCEKDTAQLAATGNPHPVPIRQFT